MITVYGSECFKKLFAGAPVSSSLPHYTSSEGRHLTDAERKLLIENTARLVQQFEAEHQAELARKAATAAIRSTPNLAPTPSQAPQATHTSPTDRQAAVAQAKQIVRATYGVNPELAGWHGLVQSEADRILRGKAG